MGTATKDGVGIRAGKMFYPLFLGQVFSVVMSALTLIVLARLLQPYNYGIYTFAISFYSLLNSFVAFGAGAYLSYALPQHLYKKDYDGLLRSVSGSYIIACGVSLTLTLFGLLISNYMAMTYSGIGITPLMMIIASSTVFVYIFSSMATFVMVGLSKGGLSSFIGGFMNLMQLVFSVILTVYFGVIGAVSALLVASLVSIVLGSYLVYRSISKYCKPRIVLPSLKQLKEMFIFTYPMGISNFLNNGMTYFSVIFIGLFVTPVVLGNYGAASRAITMVASIYGIFGLGLLPIFQAAKELTPQEKINTTYRRILELELVIVLPIIVFAAVMAVPVIYLFVGTAYATAPFYLVLLAVGSTLSLFGGYVNYLLIHGKNTFSILKVNAISAVVQLVLILLLVPYTKIIGMVVIIFFIGNLVEIFLYIKEVDATFGFRFSLKKLLRLYVSAVAFGIVLLAVYLATNTYLPLMQADLRYAVELIVGVVATLLLYPAILVVFRAIDDNDIKDLRTASESLGKASILFGRFFNYSERIYLRMRQG